MHSYAQSGCMSVRRGRQHLRSNYGTVYCGVLQQGFALNFLMLLTYMRSFIPHSRTDFSKNKLSPRFSSFFAKVMNDRCWRSCCTMSDGKRNNTRVIDKSPDEQSPVPSIQNDIFRHCDDFMLKEPRHSKIKNRKCSTSIVERVYCAGRRLGRATKKEREVVDKKRGKEGMNPPRAKRYVLRYEPKVRRALCFSGREEEDQLGRSRKRNTYVWKSVALWLR